MANARPVSMTIPPGTEGSLNETTPQSQRRSTVPTGPDTKGPLIEQAGRGAPRVFKPARYPLPSGNVRQDR